MNTTIDPFQAVLDSIRPLIAAQDFVSVCAKLVLGHDIALAEQRIADAASLSAMLGSFRSIVGDYDGALSSLREAERLEPSNADRVVVTATHLFSRMGRVNEAASIVRSLLDRPALEAAPRHEALALLGRVAAADGRLGEAVGYLAEAGSAAQSGNLEAMFWDKSLAMALAEHRLAENAVRDYLGTLRLHAEAEPDEDTLLEITKILERLETAR